MCGFVIKISKRDIIDRKIFNHQVDELVHRGPDDRGVWFSEDGAIALGSRRLAIQDLSQHGHMPLSDSSGFVKVVFNGEIYNFNELRSRLEDYGRIFRGSSDTEVLLNAYLHWGETFLDYLDGMFAFAVYDARPEISKRGKILFARDRCGEKPIFFWHHSRGFLCASELKSLMADPQFPRILDPAGLNMYLGLGYVPGKMCMLKNVQKLLPAHSGIYDIAEGSLRLWRYWSVPSLHEKNNCPGHDLVEELEKLLCKSVAQRMIADVPVGVLLSGGLDSSLITAAASRCDSQVKTFTVSFPGQGTFDEGPFAKKVADHCGTEHHVLPFEENIVDLVPQLARFIDEPIADASLVPTYIVSRLTRQHVTVCLGGDGGDELFGGYPTYDRHINGYPALNYMPSLLKRLIAYFASSFFPIGMRGRKYLAALDHDVCQSFVKYSILLDTVVRKKVLNHTMWQQIIKLRNTPIVNRLSYCADTRFSPMDRMMRMDFHSYLPDDILTKVDRASMAVSLEMRAPFLGRSIIDFAFSRVPVSLKLNGSGRKILLRLLAEKMLPKDLDWGRKQGFSLPPSIWQNEKWFSFSREVLMDERNQIFNRFFIEKLLAKSSGHNRFSGILFALVLFSLWQEHYQVSL